MSRIVLALVVAVGLGTAAMQQSAQAAESSPFQLLATSTVADNVTVAPVAYPYRYNTYYGGYGYPGYRNYRGYYGGYYRPYYTRGWRDGYALPLGRRWGVF